MEIRDILNKHGIKVGELSLPNDTPEEVWSERLASYLEVGVPYFPNVTPRQIRQALVISGVSLASIDAALDALPEPTKSMAKIEWEYSVAFVRTNPLVAQIGNMLGWTSDQIDALWSLANKL